MTASSRRKFLSQSAALATGTALTACGGSDSVNPAEFRYGVASGDPLADRVILWTHARVANSNEAVPLNWEVAKDSAFTQIVSSGKVDATEANGFTAKVDATGLTAGSSYFYRFKDGAGTVSPVGTTRTLPDAGVSSVKLAVFSCAMYSEGYYNAYADAAKSGALYAVHVGDYIYEYGAGANQYGNKDAVALGRVTVPAKDIVSLSDYRTRYALYRSDPDLQALHAKMPWITVWDDHEFANNAWVGGAENHNPATQGDWAARKANAAKAYHEWLPIRTPDAANLLKIYRRFDFGKLLTLHMLDTRIEGRDQQYDNFGDRDGGVARYIAGMTPAADGSLPDAKRGMMSAAQMNWLTQGMAASTSTWQVLGNQDVMTRMWLPASVLKAQQAALATPSAAANAAVADAINAYLTAKATRFARGAAALTPAQTALLDAKQNPSLPYNLDSWDGYPMQREVLLRTAKATGKRLVALSGDSHNAWFGKLTTLGGEVAGVEFAGSSVSSTGFESLGLGALGPSLDGSALVPTLGNAAIGASLGLVNDLQYADTSRRGYLLMTVTANAVKGEYVFVSTVKSKTYTAQVGRTITVSAAGEISYA